MTGAAQAGSATHMTATNVRPYMIPTPLDRASLHATPPSQPFQSKSYDVMIGLWKRRAPHSASEVREAKNASLCVCAHGACVEFLIGEWSSSSGRFAGRSLQPRCDLAGNAGDGRIVR